jgi:hypothetical protein
MHTLTRTALACSAVLFLGACAKSDAPADTAAANAAVAPAPAPAPAPLALADLAGSWNMRAVPESGTDTSATTMVLVATADTSGWMLNFPDGQKVPLTVSVAGDSVVTTSAPFTSQRRKGGVKVTATTTMRLENGTLAGTTIARYPGAGADSVLVLRSTATKAP